MARASAPTSTTSTGEAPHASRRREYLRQPARLLTRQLETVVDEWAPHSASNYRARFLAMPPDEALACILKGAGILSGAELAGERLTVPYETKEQEDEHSCFSDNTHRDIVYDVLGIQNVFLGRYVRTSGERRRRQGRCATCWRASIRRWPGRSAGRSEAQRRRVQRAAAAVRPGHPGHRRRARAASP